MATAGTVVVDTYATVDLAGEPTRAFIEHVTDQQHEYIAAVAAPLHDLRAENQELGLALGAGVLAALIVAVARWLAGRPSDAQAAGRHGRTGGIHLRGPAQRRVCIRRMPRTSSVAWRRRSTACSIAWGECFSRSGSSWPTPHTNSARRYPSCGQRRRLRCRMTHARPRTTASR